MGRVRTTPPILNRDGPGGDQIIYFDRSYLTSVAKTPIGFCLVPDPSTGRIIGMNITSELANGDSLCEVVPLCVGAGCNDLWYCVDGGLRKQAPGPAPEGFTGGPYVTGQSALDSDCTGAEVLTCGVDTVELPPRIHLTPTNIVLTDGDITTLPAGTATRYFLGAGIGGSTGEWASQYVADCYLIDPTLATCFGACINCDRFLACQSGTMYTICSDSDFGGFATLLAASGYVGTDPFCVVVSLFDCCAGIFGRMTVLATTAGWYQISYCTWAKPFTGAFPITPAGEVVANVRYNYNPPFYPWGFTTDIVVSI